MYTNIYQYRLGVQCAHTYIHIYIYIYIYIAIYIYIFICVVSTKVHVCPYWICKTMYMHVHVCVWVSRALCQPSQYSGGNQMRETTSWALVLPQRSKITPAHLTLGCHPNGPHGYTRRKKCGRLTEFWLVQRIFHGHGWKFIEIWDIPGHVFQLCGALLGSWLEWTNSPYVHLFFNILYSVYIYIYYVCVPVYIYIYIYICICILYMHVCMCIYIYIYIYIYI